MKNILTTLKDYKWQIILVLILLVIQAYCNLALPTYTSDIVNVGIQQNGIESLIPISIKESDYSLVKSFLTENQKTTLDKAYTYEEKKGQYNLEKISEEEKKELEDILLYPLFITLNKDKLNNTSENMQVDMKNLPQLVEKLKSEYKGNESFISQGIISSLKDYYESMDIDVEKMRMDYIYKTGGYMIAITAVAMVITILSVYLSSKVSAYFSRDLRNKAINKVMSFESEEIKEFSSSSLITRCTNDIVQVQMLITVFLRIIIYAPIMGIGAMTKVIGSSMGWVIALAVFLILTLMLVLFVVVVPKFKKFQDLLDRLNLVCRETISGLPVIRAFANEKEEEKRFEKANNNLTKNGLFINRAMAIMSPTLTFIMNGISILIVWVGANKIDAGTMQVGTMIAFITYTMQIIMAFLMVSMVAIMMPRATVSIKRISEIFNKDIKVKDKEVTEKFDKEKIGEIEFKDVYFRYPDATEDVLRNISFKATKGTTTAFIGSTGSGKSTLINLIPRFFDATNGKIIIDGKNIKDVKIKDLRDKIGYVPQKGQLFSGTIESNIAFGQKKKDKNLIEEAARISQSLEFINSTDEKFERPISQGGTNVSGGQRQRLSIARAIAKDPEIYIFDDSFSALDYKTDATLRKELNKTTKDKTVFIVAQRISSVMHADQIIVLDEGEIVGKGTHEELLKTCEVYKEIKISQLGSEE